MPQTRRNEKLPLRPPPDAAPPPRPTPAPAWAALLAAWLGLIVLAGSIVFVFLPGSRDARAELQHQQAYSPADRFLPYPVYGIAVALFVGIVVLWQMRREPRPLDPALAAQRVQAWVGIALALVATVIVYAWVAIFGP